MSRTSPVAKFRNVRMTNLDVTALTIGNVAVTATAAELNQLHNATASAAQISTLAASVGTVSFDRSVKVARVALAALDTAGGVLSWANPEAVAIIINRLVVDVTTKSTGTCTVDFGTTAVSATTTSDTLIDGLDTGTAIITADNITDKGTNGKSRQKLAAGKWVTGSMASGAAAGTVGFVYIFYTLI